MKVLMVSTFKHGGATIAARRQAEALMEKGFKCDLVSLNEDWTCEKTHVTQDGKQILVNVPASSWSYSGRITTAYCADNRSTDSNTWFSFWQNATFFDEELLQVCLKYDVIHFHWISHMVSTQFIEKLNKLGKKMIFTGHDMNHFTGGCHYNAGCRKFESNCKACPHLLNDPLKFVESSYQLKISALSSLEATWLFPSQWLLDEFNLSKLNIRDNCSQLLHNCLDTQKFIYLNDKQRMDQRDVLGLLKKEIVYIAGASDNTEKRKGFEHIEYAVDKLAGKLNRQKNKQRVVIVTFGHGEPLLAINSPYLRHLHLGSIDEEKVISLLQCADLLLFSSIEENFSNLILESLMCGCPVLGFDIGGVPDIVKTDVNGHLVKDVSSISFAEDLINLTDMSILTELRNRGVEWRDHNNELYSYKKIADSLTRIYLDASSNKVNEDYTLEHSPKLECYQSYFGAIRPNTSAMHKIISENLKRYIKLSKKSYSVATSKNHIDATFIGITEAHYIENVGRTNWMLKDNLITFLGEKNVKPGLCIQIPNEQWIVDILSRSLEALTITTNQTDIGYQVLWPEQNDSFIYLWAIPNEELLYENSINTIKLNFDSLAFPYEDDARGLCLLFSQVTLFDLSLSGLITENDASVPDYALSNALNLTVTQSFCLCDSWSKESNEKAYLSNVTDMWKEILMNKKEETLI